MISHARIAVNSTTPTLVSPDGWDDLGPNTNCTLQIQNLGTNPIYVGGEGVTSTSYGCSIVAGSALTIDDLPPQDNVYVLSSSGSGYIAVLRVIR